MSEKILEITKELLDCLSFEELEDLQITIDSKINIKKITRRISRQLTRKGVKSDES